MLAGVAAAAAARPTYAVVVTGHSLGGAVATLTAAATLRRAGYAADLYTFGSPRVGNAVFARAVTELDFGAEYRLTHEADPIPRLPPLVFNYRHTSPEYWLRDPATTPADVVVCPGYANTSCNAGTFGFDPEMHVTYIEPIDGCDTNGGGLPFKKPRRGRRQTDDVEVSDEMLEERLAAWAAMDMQFAAHLAKTAQD